MRTEDKKNSSPQLGLYSARHTVGTKTFQIVCVCARARSPWWPLPEQYQCFSPILAVQIQVETRKQSIVWEFEKYRQLLKHKPPGQQLEVEAASALASLEREERETRQKLELNHDALIQQSQVLCRLIAELEERSQRPVRWMLQVSGSVSSPTPIPALLLPWVGWVTWPIAGR